jgi:predicted PurR-regulated permease PerM
MVHDHGSGLDPTRFWLRWGRYPFVLAKLVTYVLIAYGLLAVLNSVQEVLTPILVALFIAYLLDPAVDWFEARGMSRTVGILAFLILGAGFVTLFLFFLYPTVAHILSRVGSGIPAVIELVQDSGIPWVSTDLLPWLEYNLGVEVGSMDQWTQGIADAAKTQLPGLVQRITGFLQQLWLRAGGIVASLLNLVLVPVMTFYFLRDFDRMRLSTVDYLPLHNREWLLQRIARMDEVIGAWFRGQLEVALVLAVLYAAGLGIVFGVSGIGFTSGVAIGILAGLLNVVPYFGFLVGFVLSVLLAVLDWAGLAPLVGVVVVFAVVQGLEGYVVTPRIVGEKVGLSPVVVIIALLLGGQLLGPLGVLLALPLAGSLRVLLPDAIEWYRKSDLYAGELVAQPEPSLLRPAPLQRPLLGKTPEPEPAPPKPPEQG